MDGHIVGGKGVIADDFVVPPEEGLTGAAGGVEVGVVGVVGLAVGASVGGRGEACGKRERERDRERLREG